MKIIIFNTEEKARQAEKIAADSRGCPKPGMETNGLCEKHPKEDKWSFQIFPEYHDEKCIAEIEALATETVTTKLGDEWDKVKASIK